MTGRIAGLLALIWILLAACQPAAPVCPPTTGTPETLTFPPPTAQPAQASSPIEVEIGGRTITVDRVVRGPLCNDSWSGTVYVTCDVQVLPWDEQPDFLEGCDLEIAPNTVVYVADHNDAPYYNGCSCHTGEISGP